ncbi:MAG TPA: beta galactosidase jelly roll domain-containing protein, partial [Jatrophihabitantaceae bacterium]
EHLVYSTSEIMTHLPGVALLYGRSGETGQTVLRYSSQPSVQVRSGDVTSTYDAATGDLRLDYTHNGLARVQISGGGRPTETLLLADDATAGTFWREDTTAGPALVRGPELVRTATSDHGTLRLTGDTKDASDLEVWADATHVTWNGATVQTAPTTSGSLAVDRQLPGAEPIILPALTNWRYAPESPEAQPSFDDSTWTAAEKTTTNSTTKPPAGQPVLTADDYGFHQGDVWYRGHYSGATSSIDLRYGGGGAGLLQAWLDGVYLGQNVLPNAVSSPPTTGTATFTVPAALRTSGPHVLSVMVRNDGHNEDGGVNDAQKEGRGLISVTSDTSVPISWRIQGNLGGEDIADPTRGVLNNGGLYGERHGWYLPGYPDGAWQKASVPAATATPGTSWYRTTFDLHIPKDDDASLGLTIGDPSTPHSAANYRALIFVNGWNMGQYIANVGPQHTFVIPNGVLDPDGHNTLAIAVTSDGGAGNGLENVALTDLGTVRGGVPVAVNHAPSWNAATWGTPQAPNQVAVESLTGDAANPARPGDTFDVSTTIRNSAGPSARDVAVDLSVPDGWTAVADGPTRLDELAPGASATMHWKVTVGPDATTSVYYLSAIATYGQGTASGRTGATYSVSVREAGDLFVSDLPFVSSTNGWGPVERDTNVGDQAAGDGGPISIDGATYAKGLGVNSVSSVVVDLGGTCTNLSTDVGVDDLAGGRGSVTFTVLADGAVAAQTGVLRGGQPVQHLSVDLTGVHLLTLNVGDGGDGNGHDNADWAGAELHCAA